MPHAAQEESAQHDVKAHPGVSQDRKVASRADSRPHKLGVGAGSFNSCKAAGLFGVSVS